MLPPEGFNTVFNAFNLSVSHFLLTPPIQFSQVKPYGLLFFIPFENKGLQQFSLIEIRLTTLYSNVIKPLLKKSIFIFQCSFKIRKKEQAHYVFNIIHFLFLLAFPFFGDRKRLFIGNDSIKG
ncbi:hypothetical protein [Photorhabdus bodei]|uniref:Uncharacterized protein n=1 Tax=Photorhabdus bodei TaxID=2029681 RepID=A0A329XAV0_9GAMM|nr:hypothetical protein [Photorhabdus bodei]NDL01031.1 hypothetical protein [Photorhabdus bodei]NDL05280.1 hypothetical protein [Photorhabdus bodei]NDL09534.1 hypothetical protein [Photorhabdus bodei]RAX13736.1 hypothetical protein CKY02_04580 [Photorhabdus bodei]